MRDLKVCKKSDGYHVVDKARKLAGPFKSESIALNVRDEMLCPKNP